MILLKESKITFCSILFFVLLSIGCTKQLPENVQRISWVDAEYKPGGYVFPDSTNWKKLAEVGYDYADQEPFLWAKFPLPKQNFKHPAIYLFSEVDCFTIYIDSLKAQHEGFTAFHEYPRFYRTEPYFVCLEENPTPQHLFIRFKKNNALLILDNPKICIGERTALYAEARNDLASQYRDNRIREFIANSLIFLGIGFVFAYFRRRDHMAVLSFGLFSFLAGFFIIFSMDTATILNLNMNLVPLIQTFLYYLIFIAFLHFSDYMYASEKFNWIRVFWVSILLILIPGYWICLHFNILTFWFEILPLFSIISLLFNILTIIRSRKKMSTRFHFMITAFSILYIIMMTNSFLQFFQFFIWSFIPLDWGLFTLVIGFSLLFSEHYIYTRTQMTTVQKELLEMQKENYRTKLNALKRQLNPHFLFNSLANLISLIEIDPEDAIVFTEELSDVYRYILESSKKDLATIQSELDFLVSYNYLLKTRFKDNYALQIDVPDLYLQHKIPVLSLQILVENIFKHNIINAQKKMLVRINVADDKLIVCNDLHSKKINVKSGFGLENLEKRLAYFTNKKIEVKSNHKQFNVAIPILPSNTEILKSK